MSVSDYTVNKEKSRLGKEKEKIIKEVRRDKKTVS